jgi:hypothetical protein
MTKTELKSIIKECLLEILTDGLGDSLAEAKQQKVKAQKLIEEKEHVKRMQLRKKEVADSVSFMTDDPILRKVLSHTAQTTLKEQMANDRVPSNTKNVIQESNEDVDDAGGIPGDPGIDINSIFGGATKNWAVAAFAPSKTTQ